MLHDIIPAEWRKPIYVVYALIGVVLGALVQVFGGVDHVPEWHAIATNVYLYVGGAFGLTAAANTIIRRDDEYRSSEGVHVGDFEDAGENPHALTVETDTTPTDPDYEPKH